MAFENKINIAFSVEREVSKYRRIKTSDVFLVGLCIFVSDAMSLPLPQNIKVVLATMICFFIVALHLIKNRFVIRKNEIVWVYIMSVFVLLPQLLYFDLALSYEYKVLQMYVGFIIATTMPFSTFKRIFIKLIYVCSIVSIAVWFLRISGFNNWSWLPMSGDGQYNTLFFTVIDNMGSPMRNPGPFWEPGVFQMYINIALIFLLFSKEKVNRYQLIIFLFALFTTFSTTGFICFFIILLAYYSRNDKFKLFHFVIGVVFILLCYYFITRSEVNELVFGKFSSDSQSNASFVIRMNELTFYFETWTSNIFNFFFGEGTSNAYNAAMYLHSDAIVRFEGSTQTTLRELASYGLFYGIMRILLIFKFSSFLGNGKLASILLFACFMLMINTESMLFSILFNGIFYYGLVKQGLYYSDYYKKANNREIELANS